MESIKFRDIKEPNQLNALILKLRICNILVKGDNITQVQEQILAKFISEKFSDMNSIDVEEGVKLYLSDKLNCDAKYCVKMSGEYFGIILAAYRTYKRDKQAELKKAIPMQTTEIIKTPEQNYFELINYIEKNAKIPEWGSNIFLSAYVYFDKVINESTTEDKKAFAEEMKSRKEEKINFLKKQGLSQNIRAEIVKITNELNRKLDFQNECRVEYIKDYLIKKYLK